MLENKTVEKRKRRSNAEMEAIKIEIYDTLKLDNPQTLRQLYYQLTVKGVIEKTDAEYKNLARLTAEMRKRGILPFSWFSDNTRWMRKPSSFDSMEQMLLYCQQTYRRAIWTDQPHYCEIWCEKDALAGVIYEITSLYDVPLMITRGYPSLSFVNSAADAIREINKPTSIFYFGDRDPTGVNIPATVENHLREHAPKSNITFEIVGVTPQQIRDWKLPTRPTKKSDTRAKNFVGDSVELDAIPPRMLKKLVQDSIESVIDKRVLNLTKIIEQQERDSFLRDLGLRE